MVFKKLEDYPLINRSEGEKILCVQRQHQIVLISESVLLFVIVFFLPFLLLLLGYSFTDWGFSIVKNPIFLAYVLLSSSAIFLVFQMYIYLSWYFHLYIITNKALMERFVFRISGPYAEIVFGEKLHVQEIIRKPINLIYDFLRINDVYVYFHKLEKEEPFIFRSPENCQQIEDLIEELSAYSKDGNEMSNFKYANG